MTDSQKAALEILQEFEDAFWGVHEGLAAPEAERDDDRSKWQERIRQIIDKYCC